MYFSATLCLCMYTYVVNWNTENYTILCGTLSKTQWKRNIDICEIDKTAEVWINKSIFEFMKWTVDDFRSFNISSYDQKEV